MHSYHISNFLAGLVAAQNQFKYSFTYYQNTKFILENIKILLKEGYVSGYTVQKEKESLNNIITVFLKYTTSNNIPLIRSVYFYSTPSKNWTLTYRDLVKLLRKRSKMTCFILSTSSGLQTSTYCLRYKQSGVLLYRVN